MRTCCACSHTNLVYTNPHPFWNFSPWTLVVCVYIVCCHVLPLYSLCTLFICTMCVVKLVIFLIARERGIGQYCTYKCASDSVCCSKFSINTLATSLAPPPPPRFFKNGKITYGSLINVMHTVDYLIHTIIIQWFTNSKICVYF